MHRSSNSGRQLRWHQVIHQKLCGTSVCSTRQTLRIGKVWKSHVHGNRSLVEVVRLRNHYRCVPRFFTFTRFHQSVYQLNVVELMSLVNVSGDVDQKNIALRRTWFIVKGKMQKSSAAFAHAVPLEHNMTIPCVRDHKFCSKWLGSCSLMAVSQICNAVK